LRAYHWYRFIPQVGYSLVGQTLTPEGAQLHKLKVSNQPG
jgi:hypothetical protein